MAPSCLLSGPLAVISGVMVWVVFSLYTLDPLVPTEHHTAYLSIAADRVHPFMTTVYLSPEGYS